MATNETTVKITADGSGVAPGVADAQKGMSELVSHVKDVTNGFLEGANPVEAFGDHLSGVFGAVSDLTGIAGGFIGFMKGPWGIAIGGAISVIGALASKLGEAQVNTEELRKSQADLAAYLDRTTGKVTDQISKLALLAHARDVAAQKAKDLEAYKGQREKATDTLTGAFKPLYIDNGFATMKVEDDLTGDDATKAKVMGFLGRYKAGLINITQLYESVNRLAGANPALKSVAGEMLDIALATQKRAQDYWRDVIEEARIAVALGEANDAQKKLVASSTEMNAATTKSIDLQKQLSSVIAGRQAPSRHIPTKKSWLQNSDKKIVAENSPRAEVFVSGSPEKPFALSEQTRTKFVADVKGMYDKAGKIVGPSVEAQRAKWKGLADSIAGAWGQSLQGMIKGTQNFRGMMLNIGNAILGEATKWIEKKASTFIAKELAQTQATIFGVGARNSVEATGAATSTAISATTSLTQIAHSAAGAAANTYKVVASQLPYGPYIAPVMAAAALAGVLAFGKGIFSAEGGMGQVPYDGAMFELHKDEMVLPASLATPMRSMLLGPAINGNMAMPANDAAITHNHYYNIKGLDGQDVHRVLMRHHGSVAQAAAKAYRYGFKP